MGLFDAISDVANGIVDGAQDLVGGALDAVGLDEVGDAINGVVDGAQGLANGAADTVADFAGGAFDLLTSPLQALPFLDLPKVGDLVAAPIDTIVDFLPGIIVDIFQPIDLPGFPNPGTTPGAPDLEGLDPMTALFVIMSYMEERLGSTMEKLATLVEVQSRLQDAGALDQQNGIDKDDPKSATSAARAEIGKEFGEEFENMDLTTVSSAINALTFQVQRTESFRQQLNTMVSNLQKSDHEAKMVTLRNIPTR